MVARRKDADNSESRQSSPATTPEAREHRLVGLAFDLAEKQLRDGSASAQVVTHFLKFGTEREKLEREKLRNDNLLAQAKIEDLKSGQRIEELYGNAIKAMREYGGQDDSYEDGY